MILIKNDNEVQKIRVGGRLLSRVMSGVLKEVRPGITTKYLDEIAYKLIKKYGGKPSFLGYAGFPASICTSINEEIVHGIPSFDRKVESGDILSIDIGIFYDGFHTDMAVTVPIGEVEEKYKNLITVTREALNNSFKKCKIGNTIGDIGNAIETFVSQRGYSVVREYTGHGIGRELHEDPLVPNYGRTGTGEKLVKGMILAIEPMVNMGTWQTKVKPDKWTVITLDRSRSAHFEHTVLITENESEILTLIKD